MEYRVEKFSQNNLSMGYMKFGSGEKNLIVIPGLNVKSILLSAEIIAQGNSIFAENGFSVYVFDRRDDAQYPYSIEKMAADTLHVIRELKLDNLYLYGHSQGGMIAQCMVMQEKELFKKVVFSSTVSHLNSNSEKVFTYWINYARNHDVKGLYEDFERTTFSESFAKVAHKAMVAEAESVTEEELTRFIPNTENMFDFDVTDQLSEIKTDSFVIGSKSDKVFDYELIRELAEKSHSKSFFFENVGHSPAFETPEYNQRILNFLQS